MNIEGDIPHEGITGETTEETTEEENEALINVVLSPRHKHIKKDLQDLSTKCLAYKRAHSECKSNHFLYDKIIKITMLFLSTITTYFISSHNEENMSAEDLEVDRKLTFLTTVVSGINAIFNFSEKIEIHKSLNSEYLDLYNEIEKNIRLFSEKIEEDEDIRGIYEEYHEIFRNLNKRTSEIGIIRHIKKKYGTI